MIPIVQQTSLFARGVAQGRTIDVDITGPDLERLVDLGGRLFGRLRELLPQAQIRPVPSLDLSQPELRFMPDRVRAAAVGLTAADVGLNLDVLVEGAKIDEVNRGGYSIDLQLMAEGAQVDRTQDLGRMQINTPDGKLVTLESVAPPELVGGPTQINHIERERAITLRVYPPEEMALAEAMDVIRGQAVEPMLASGQVAQPYAINLSGTADDLTRTADALQGNFLLALAITFLLMAALFESLPLSPGDHVQRAPGRGGRLPGAVGGQPADHLPGHGHLTMLGFVILVGIVVNNAILIVSQALAGLREEGLSIPEAVKRSVDIRVRPIFMSTLTSVSAMLPLVVFPGPGSELYRGLGSVVVGGLLVSTVFTLFLIPALLSLVLDARRALAGAAGREFKA